MKNFLKAISAYSRAERNGILVLLILILLIYLSRYLIPYLLEERPVDFSRFKQQFALLEQRQAENADEKNSWKRNTPEKTVKLFPFDPNTLIDTAWAQLGFSRKQIASIRKYQTKGGRFYKKEDLKKMYCISATKYQLLEPYISIVSINKEIAPITKKAYSKPILIAINRADSLQLIQIKGIGPILTLRILKFRAKLGGFSNVEQLKEVYGIDSTKFANLQPVISIKVEDIQQLSINQAAFEQLKIHPYIGYKLAKAIVNYREQHGNYQSIDELKKIVLITAENFKKLKPYLTL